MAKRITLKRARELKDNSMCQTPNHERREKHLKTKAKWKMFITKLKESWIIGNRFDKVKELEDKENAS